MKSLAAPTTVGALDLGSNSFHLVVARIESGTITPVFKEKDMILLGSEVADSGHISPRMFNKSLASATRLIELAQQNGAQVVRVVATAAFRDANNGQDLANAIREHSGVDVEIISGLQEAQFIFAAMQAAGVLGSGSTLGVDVGGGSVEFSIGIDSKLTWCSSEKLGVARLSKRYVHSDPISAADLKEVVAAIDHRLRDLKSQLKSVDISKVVFTSGTLDELIEMADPVGDSATVEEMLVVCQKVIQSDSATRRSWKTLSRKRLNLVVAGAIVCQRVLLNIKKKNTTVARGKWALREGVLLGINCTDI